LGVFQFLLERLGQNAFLIDRSQDIVSTEGIALRDANVFFDEAPAPDDSTAWLWIDIRTRLPAIVF